MIPTGDALVAILNELRPTKVDSWFFRMVSPQWIKTLDSPEGARIRGGRYNPPLQLAERTCGIPGGFGYLYTSTHPITCLFECRHLRRGLGNKPQTTPVEPTLLVTFIAESDRVLDLRDEENQKKLGLTKDELIDLDQRSTFNARGQLTALQQLGTAIYNIGRFSGILAPSRYTDMVGSDSFDFLPDQVKPKVQDVENVLARITLADPAIRVSG